MSEKSTEITIDRRTVVRKSAGVLATVGVAKRASPPKTTRRERLLHLIETLSMDTDDGAPVKQVLALGATYNLGRECIEECKRKGEVYEPKHGYLRTVRSVNGD